MLDNRTQEILLIDDSPEDRALVRSALIQGAPQRRFIFREASNGREGLELLQSLEANCTPDCVIVDINMPNLSGLEFLAEISQDHLPVAPYPVIVLTGSLEVDATKAALSQGAQDYITKDAIFPQVMPRLIDNAIERHKLMIRLTESERAADAANRAKSALISNISHEIRTPMTAVVGLTEVMLDDSISTEQQHTLEMIRDNGKYLIEIVNDLLDLSKLEAGMLKFDPEPTELRAFLQETIELMQVRALEKSTLLLIETADELPLAVQIDPIRLRQVLINLIGNAIKFTPKGTVTLEVRGDQQRHGYIEFLVRDTGCGIAAEDLDEIFQPFAQARQERTEQVKGTGLGLAICQRLTTAMNGTISVSSELGEGTCFNLVIPANEVKDYQPTIETRQQTLSDDVLSGCRVAVAEDTRSIQYLIRKFVTGAGGELFLFDDGLSLLDAQQSGQLDVDVILTDLRMPRMDGHELTQKLRAQGVTTPIIVLTADAKSETRDLVMTSGANDLVTKPIDRATFLGTLAHWCDLANCD